MTFLVSSVSLPPASSAESGIGSSIFCEVFGNVEFPAAITLMWLAADNVGIQTILPPSLIVWSTAWGLMPPDALFSAIPE